jgi:hypothetical protein
MTGREIPRSELTSAMLAIDYTVLLRRRPPPLRWPCAEFDFACTGLIHAPDREYLSTMKAKKEWGLAA